MKKATNIVAGAKWCPECAEWRLLSDFFRDKRSSTGLTSYCKGCMTRRNAESKERRAHGERIAQRRRPRVLRDNSDTKRCPACGETKLLDEFVRNRTQPRGVGAYCLPCHNRITRENVQKNHGSTRTYHLKGRYGVTAEDVAAMVEVQGGTCAICRVRPAEHVDHDHETGDVRGILCFTCNVGLGNFGDEPRRLLLAHRYLTRPTADESERVRARLRLIMERAS